MKAKIKVKETGEILDFASGSLVCGLRKKEEVEFAVEDIEIIPEPTEDEQHWQELRERAAIAAMQGILCAPIIEGIDPNPSQEQVAKWAIMQADALIEQLKKK